MKIRLNQEIRILFLILVIYLNDISFLIEKLLILPRNPFITLILGLIISLLLLFDKFQIRECFTAKDPAMKQSMSQLWSLVNLPGTFVTSWVTLNSKYSKNTYVHKKRSKTRLQHIKIGCNVMTNVETSIIFKKAKVFEFYHFLYRYYLYIIDIFDESLRKNWQQNTIILWYRLLFNRKYN